jgi:hypothetical protein
VGLGNPSEWYSRRHMDLAAAVLILIGTWTAIILLPTILLALTIFFLISGFGLYVAYKEKKLLLTVGITSICPGLLYMCTMLISARGYYALLYDLGTITLVPLIASGISALVWFAWRKRAPTSKTISALRRPVLFTCFALLVIVPFVIGGLHDYNMRADASFPEVIRAKIVAKYMGTDLDGDHFPAVTLETPGGKLRFDYSIDWRYYELGVGDYCAIIIRDGALGYQWIVEGYALR